jgi:cytochrome c-type biogenesis protein CcmH
VSIGLVIGLVGLTSLTIALLLLPLLARQGRAAARKAYNLAVYRDQLAEVERDAARGLLDPEQAEAAHAEIGRRILALDTAERDTAASSTPRATAVVVILLMPVAALLLYARLGSPSLPDQPFAERRGSAPTRTADAKGEHLDLREALAKLRAHLKEHPEDLTGQLLLARSELGLGHFEAAADAYRLAFDLSGHRADIASDWGEAQVLAADGKVTAAAREAFEVGLKDPETSPRSRYYLALGRMQQGDARGALQEWTELEADSPKDAAWLPLVRQRIADAAAAIGVDPPTGKAAGSARTTTDAPKAAADPATMPTAAAVAAAAKATEGASAAERDAMVRAMVQRLAARLEQHPDDGDGWARLGRSYMVLHQPDKAREAYVRAVKLKPDDVALKQALAEATAATTAPVQGPQGSASR